MKERIASLFTQRLKVVFVVTTLQLIFTTGLIVWWGKLLVRHAEENATLSIAAGGDAAEADERIEKTRRMIVFEGTWFTVVIASSTLFLLGLYYRDVKRTRSLQAFFASLTHELKTPLTSVRLQAESIADIDMPDQYAGKLVKRLLQDTSRLETQVERALELARLEGGGRLMTRRVQLKPLLDRAVETWVETEAERICITNDAEDAFILADTTALQIVLKNLFENSIRHSKKTPVHVRLTSQAAGQRYVLIYTDNGVGPTLPLAQLGRLFVKNADSHGAGVGLYLVKALLKNMQGEADFRNANGFTATLSFKKAEA